MDRATMLAENQERERQFTYNMAFQAAPPWPVREGSVVHFAWPHKASVLIHQRHLVREIMDLRAKVENNFPGVRGSSQESFQNSFKGLGVHISFQEAFVSSHEQRVSLIDRVHEHYDNDTHWQRYILDILVKSFPQTAPGGYFHTLEMAVANWKTTVTQHYTIAQSTMSNHIEAILQMQALCEDLKPETRELVSRCSSFEQLDRSMLMTQGKAVSFPNGFAFKATAPMFATPKAFM